MLTKEAWNAFLKTLEEPPPNTVFVLATTEAHKVMATIADRCQRFDFQRPSLEQISEVLERVSAAEGIELEPGAGAMIARSASGSFRDALGTLDQLVAFGGRTVAVDAVVEIVGAVEAEILFETLDAVIAEDPRGVLLGVERMAGSGRDPSQFARDLLAHLRHLLVVQTVGEAPSALVVTAADEGRLRAQAGAIGPANLMRTIDELAAALTAIREGDDARLAVEVALLKAARPDVDPSSEGLLRRIERLERGGGAASPPTPRPAVSQTTTASVAPETTASSPGGDPEPVKEDPEPAEEEEAEPPRERERGEDPEEGTAGPDSLGLEEMRRIWPAVLEKLRESSPALAATFEGARPVEVEADAVRIGFPADSTFNKRKAEVPDKREQMAVALEAVAGTPLRPLYVLLDGGEEAVAPGLDHDAIVEKLKSEFNAEEVG
jgi:DNA polymerase-3 subunit gamma/tau